jgi:signal transduction histidine kinase
MRTDHSVGIAVCDSGPGIAPETLEQCLQPFFQADMSAARVAEGLGLGMAISRKIVEMHGGELIVESKPGHGTLATLRLPVSTARAREMHRAAG